MSVKLIKLSCGDLLIAETNEQIVIKEGIPFLVVRRPLRIALAEKGIILQIWCPCDLEKDTEINLSRIDFYSPAVEQLAKEYQAKFTSAPKIVTPPSGLVV